MNKHKVTIAIPAWNEEENILNVLNSLLKQKTQASTIEKIIVVVDGSTDRTAEYVGQFAQKYQIVKVINHKENKGKVTRLNEIYRLNKSEFLIILDADIRLSGYNFVDTLCDEIAKNDQIVLVAAHQIPVGSNTLVSKSIAGAYRIWDDTRLSVPNYDHIQNFYGAASIYRKSFADKLDIPKEITDERGFIYLMAKKYGIFKYTKKVCIYYRHVATLHDLWKLGDRSFSKNQEVLSKIFGQDVSVLYDIPVTLKIRSIAKNLIKDPIFTTAGFILNILIRMFPMHDDLYEFGKWESSRSTKLPISEVNI